MTHATFVLLIPKMTTFSKTLAYESNDRKFFYCPRLNLAGKQS